MHKKGSLINILKDNEFSKSREALAAKRKNLVRQGKGNCPNATRELTEAEEDALFENGQFGVQDPKSLQRALWWFLSLHFGWRARDESRKLCWGDVGLASDPETDSEYLVWKSERGSKTRTGQDAGHQRALETKAHANSRGFIKGRSLDKLTGCEHDFARLLYISNNFFLIQGAIKNSFKLQSCPFLDESRV